MIYNSGLLTSLDDVYCRKNTFTSHSESLELSEPLSSLLLLLDEDEDRDLDWPSTLKIIEDNREVVNITWLCRKY